MNSKTAAAIVQSIAFVLDVSPSMAGSGNGSRAAILDLNDSLATFLSDLRSITICGVEVMFITFADDVQVQNDFEDVSSLSAPVLQTRGVGTDLGGGIGRALQELKERKAYLSALGQESKQPWLVCITDGMPNQNSAPGFDAELVDLGSRRKLHFLPVAVGGHGAYDVLERLSPGQKPIVVNPGGGGGMSFKEFFAFLSASVASGQAPNLQALKSHE